LLIKNVLFASVTSYARAVVHV